jgi:hypothetical protein
MARMLSLLCLVFCCFLVLPALLHAQVEPASLPDRPKKNAVKIAVMAPLLGHTQVGYERYLGKGRTIEIKLGLANVPRVASRDLKGGYMRVGPKFLLRSKLRNGQAPVRPLLEGAYLRPELIWSSFLVRESIFLHGLGQWRESIQHDIAVAAILSVGYQLVLWDPITVDISAGAGIAVSEGNSDAADGGFKYGFAMRQNFGPAGALGFTVGFMF